MRITLFFSLVLLMVGCDFSKTERSQNITLDDVKVEIPDKTILIENVFYDKKNSTWRMLNDSSHVSGHIVRQNTSDLVIKKFSVFQGKKEGPQYTYYPSGELKFLETFKNNQLHGAVKRWSYQNGYQIIAHLQYRKGKLHGEQLKWFPTGELHKKMNILQGKEEGLQQAFRKNGALYANYEAKKGRIFGLKRSNLCYELNDEEIVYNQEDKNQSTL